MRWRVLLAICVTLMVFSVVLIIVGPRRTAARMRAQGRLSQLHLALLNYQTVHGVLPDRNVTDSSGRPLYSWVATILPYIDQNEIANSLDLSQPWNSPLNAASLASGKRFWSWYSEDGFFICTFDGADSLWYDSGNPRGRLADFPTGVVLIATTIEGIHPLEPFCLSEERLHKILKSGHQAIYVDADRFHGTIHLEGESIVFARGTLP